MMGSFYFAKHDQYGYGIICVKTVELNPLIEAEAERIAALVKRAEAFETDLEITEALSFNTDGEPFAFEVEVAADRSSVTFKTTIHDQVMEHRRLQV